MPHVEQDLLTLPDYLKITPNFGGIRVFYSLVFCVVSCVLLFVCLSFSFLAMALSVYVSIYEFDCPDHGLAAPPSRSTRKKRKG